MRPFEHMHAAGRDYPGVWRRYDRFLTQRNELGDWPAWCYCPMAAAYAIVSGGGTVRSVRGSDVARVAALAAWRPTQGIYRFDPDVLAELWETPLTGDLPAEHLQRLPEWCVYVELPNRADAHGFFVHLEYDAKDGRSELRLLIDIETQLVPIALHLVGTLEQAVAASLVESQTQAAQRGMPMALGADLPNHLQAIAGPLVSVLLYLCAEDPELRPTRDVKRRRELPRMKRGRDGQPYMPEARRPEVWETGFRLGAALRSAREHDQHQGGTVRGHIRRAHWHGYWIGSGDQRRLSLRWLPPIPVNLDDPERPTVRRVDDLSSSRE